jgi:hypothetical protein
VASIFKIFKNNFMMYQAELPGVERFVYLYLGPNFLLIVVLK